MNERQTRSMLERTFGVVGLLSGTAIADTVCAPL
jgi:hypothetical protein